MKIIFLLFFLCSAKLLYGQNNYEIKGSVSDILSNQTLANATITVLTSKDSILTDYTYVLSNGSFSLKGLESGKYILMVSYPEYADFVENFELNPLKPILNFGTIYLNLKSRILKEVIVKAKKTSTKLLRDTIEFNAGSFVIQPNATVEDLLRQLPGIQISKNGKIRAQGQVINKVLVDGEEFFGDDPTLVTQNIRADMVDKVQLFDKKSDQSTFTGADDNNKQKTINIKLKANKKNGSFGKIDAGSGTNKYYQNQVLANRFNGDQKLSIYGTLANTGKLGLTYQENSRYNSTSDAQMLDVGGATVVNIDNSDALESYNGRYNGLGIPKAAAGGGHFNDKWDQGQQSINTNYKVGYLATDGTSVELTQNNLPSEYIKSYTNHVFDNSFFKQKFDATYIKMFDKTFALKIAVDETTNNGTSLNKYVTSSSKGSDILLNQNERQLYDNANRSILHGYILLTKKLKKQGRSVSFTLDEYYNQNQSNGYINSNTKFFDGNSRYDSTQVTNQVKVGKESNSFLQTNLSYTEAISKSLNGIFNYGLGITNNNSDRRSYNQTSPTILDSTYSNSYRFDNYYNELGASFNYNRKKAFYSIGSTVGQSRYEQYNTFTGETTDRNYIIWNPHVGLSYTLSKQSSFKLNFYGNTIQPTINQLQPLITNSDPLNVMVGNPTLKPSFRNLIRADYTSFKVLNDQFIYFSGLYTTTNNPIVSNIRTDSAGKSTYKYVNLDNKNSTAYSISLILQQKLKESEAKVGVQLTVQGNNYYNQVNDEQNITKTVNYLLMFNLSKFKENKYDFDAAVGPIYSIAESSIQKLNNNGSGLNGNTSVTIYIARKFQFKTDVDYQYRAKTDAFDYTFNRFLWNASITRSFLKKDNLKVLIKGYDLLDQNKGYDRVSNGSLLTQNTYTTIRRYFMISVNYNFNKVTPSK